MSLTGSGRKLGQKRSARVSLLRNLATELLRHEKIVTTHAKAKECSRMAEHLISLAKKGDLVARRKVARDLHDSEVTKKLFDVLSQRYATRTGGCTQVFRLAPRSGDNAEMALIKLIA